MAKTFSKSLLCAEQHAKCQAGMACLIPAMVLKGIFYYPRFINRELSLRKVM